MLRTSSFWYNASSLPQRVFIWGLLGIAALGLHLVVFTVLQRTPELVAEKAPDTVAVQFVGGGKAAAPAAKPTVRQQPVWSAKALPAHRINSERNVTAVASRAGAAFEVPRTGVASPGNGDGAASGASGEAAGSSESGRNSAPDLSAAPELVAESIVKPEYTDAALDADFEGDVLVSVLVAADGGVEAAELRHGGVGFGMDARILAAARSAKFLPGKDSRGEPQVAWTAIKFHLRLP